MYITYRRYAKEARMFIDPASDGYDVKITYTSISSWKNSVAHIEWPEMDLWISSHTHFGIQKISEEAFEALVNAILIGDYPSITLLENDTAIAYKDSDLGKRKLQSLTDSPDVTKRQTLEYFYLKWEETTEEKVDDVARSYQYGYIVNITTEKKKKVATITKPDWVIELDLERGDINTSDLKVAEEYKRIVEEESLEAAMNYFKSL